MWKRYKHKVLLSASITLCVCILCYHAGVIPACPPRWVREEARCQISDYYDRIGISMHLEEVIKIYKRFRYNSLSLEIYGHNVFWARTPQQWNAENWILFIVFEEARVVAVIIRYQDSYNAKPLDAPLDKVKNNYQIDDLFHVKYIY